jgi:hypothetical protein
MLKWDEKLKIITAGKISKKTYKETCTYLGRASSEHSVQEKE